MSDITKPIRKYSAACCEYPLRILAYSPNILVRILRIHRVSSRIRSRICCVSCVFSRILAYSRVFAAYPAYPRILAYSSRILAYSRIFSRILAYSRVFSRIHLAYPAYSPRIHPRILAYLPRIRRVCYPAYSCVFLRIPRVSAYGLSYISPERACHLGERLCYMSRHLRRDLPLMADHRSA